MSTSTFSVTGMTCGHCEKSVEEEVGEVSGVTAVKADHSAGTVTVTGENFAVSSVRAAVEEAGYSLEA